MVSCEGSSLNWQSPRTLPSRDTNGALSLISMASDVLRVLQRSELVHKLQRERGVTCGSVASSDPTLFFSGRMLEQREQTFLSFSDTDLLPAETATLQQLQQIRARADSFIKQVDKSGEQAAVAFYSIFSQFNQLILAVLDRTAGGGIDSPRHNNFEIFDAFARLKEATGVERAFLCGALALPPAALAHLPSRAFADLVIGMQQQRSHEAIIRDTAPPKLLELIRAGFEYSPELRDVQARLLEDFDVARLRETLGADRCWNLLTEHIDKLERLQVSALSLSYSTRRCPLCRSHVICSTVICLCPVAGAPP